jgi:hypothetical protein
VRLWEGHGDADNDGEDEGENLLERHRGACVGRP